MMTIQDIRHILPDYLGGKKIDPDSRIARNYSTELTAESFPNTPYLEGGNIASGSSWIVDIKRANLASTYIQPSEHAPELEAQSLALHLESFLGHHIGKIELSNLSEIDVAEIINDLRCLPVVKKDEQFIILPSDLKTFLNHLVLTYPQLAILGRLGDTPEAISQSYALHLEVTSLRRSQADLTQSVESITISNLLSGEEIQPQELINPTSAPPLAIQIHNLKESSTYLNMLQTLFKDRPQSAELSQLFDFEKPITPHFHQGLFLASIPLLHNGGGTPFELSLNYMNVMVGHGAIITVQKSGTKLVVDRTTPVIQEPKNEEPLVSHYYFSAVVNNFIVDRGDTKHQADINSLNSESNHTTNYLYKLLNEAIEHNLDQAIAVECNLPRLKDAMHQKKLKLSSLVNLPDKTEKTALQVSIATEICTRISDNLKLLDEHQLDQRYMRKYESVISRLGAKVEDLRATAQSISGEIGEKEQKMRDRKNLVLAGIAGSLGILGIGSQLLSVADDIMMVQIQQWIAKHPGMQTLPHAIAFGSTVLMVLLLSSGTIGYRWHQRRISQEESQSLDLDEDDHK